MKIYLRKSVYKVMYKQVNKTEAPRYPERC